MSETLLLGKSLKEYTEAELDNILKALSNDDLEILERELIDPDDPCVPPSDRCVYKCTKAPTGPYCRKRLLDFLMKKAKEEKDWEETKTFTKEVRGKVYKARDEEKVKLNEDEKVETEWDSILNTASEKEIVDLAAILGFFGMLNQVQYHQAFVDSNEDKNEGGFQGIAKHQSLKIYDDDNPNDTDVEAALEKLKANDKELKELNLNNIKNISLDMLRQFAAALKTNTHLEVLLLANTRATDRVAKAFAEALKENRTLQVLNMESNYISGEGILALLDGMNNNQTVIEFHIANQKPQVLGHKVEHKIKELVLKNSTLVKFGIFLEIAGARVKVQERIEFNIDRTRKTRMGFELPLPVPKPEEKKEEVKTEAKKDAGKEAAAKPGQKEPPPKPGSKEPGKPGPKELAKPGPKEPAKSYPKEPAKPGQKAEPAKPAPKAEPAKPATKTEPTKPAPKTEPAKPAPKIEPAKPVPKAEPGKPAPKAEPANPAPKAVPSKPAPKTEPAKPVPKTEPAKPAPKAEPAKPPPKVEPAKSTAKVESSSSEESSSEESSSEEESD